MRRGPRIIEVEEKGGGVSVKCDGREDMYYGPASVPFRGLIGAICGTWGHVARLRGKIIIPLRGGKRVWVLDPSDEGKDEG